MGPVAKRMKKSISLKKTGAIKLKRKWGKPKKSISAQNGVTKIKNVNKRSFDPNKANRGVVLLKNIPHGFYEEEMRKYFGQFGLVTRVRLARSQRTGRSRGFAYIEFKIPEVAQIAADTMNNYLMFKHVLKTVYIPPEKQTFNFFRKDVTFTTDSDGRKSYSSDKTKRTDAEVERINRITNESEHANRMKRNQKILKKQQQKYGVDLSHILVSNIDSASKPEPVTKEQPSETVKKGKKAKKAAEPCLVPEENQIVPKKDKKKMKDDETSTEGKSLLSELLNVTYETDTSDEDFKIDYSFSAPDYDSNDSSASGNGLMDLLSPKLSAAFLKNDGLMDSKSEEDDNIDKDEDDHYKVSWPPLKDTKKLNKGNNKKNGASHPTSKVFLKRTLNESSDSVASGQGTSTTQSEPAIQAKKKKQNLTKKKQISANFEGSTSELDSPKVTIKKKKTKNARLEKVIANTKSSSSEAESKAPTKKQKKGTATSTNNSTETEVVSKKIKKKKLKTLNDKKPSNSSFIETTSSEPELQRPQPKKKKLKLLADDGNTSETVTKVVEGTSKVVKEKLSTTTTNTTNNSSELENVKQKSNKKQPVTEKLVNLKSTTASSKSKPESLKPKKKDEPAADGNLISEPVDVQTKKKKQKPVISSTIVGKNSKPKIKLNSAKRWSSSSAWTSDDEEPQVVKPKANLKTIVHKKKGTVKAKKLDGKKVKGTPLELVQTVSSKVFKQKNQLQSKKKSK